MSASVIFNVNGEERQLTSEGIDERLVNFLHDNHLRGTHTTCYEGGCGACTVVATVPVTGSDSGEVETFSFNSCLASVYGCDGWDITTIEGLGNRYDGYHLLQERLAEYNGTQCGYCSPGMVMNMHGLTQTNPSWTASDVERHLDGNICRCTGYRSILDAFKSVTNSEIEDLGKKINTCCKGKTCCRKGAKKKSKKPQTRKQIIVDGITWEQPTSIEELNGILSTVLDGAKYRLTCGNTGEALYSDGPYSVYINTRMIPELYVKQITTDSATFGLNLSITNMIAEFRSLTASNPDFAYLEEIANHWVQLGNSNIRNLGSVGGNLALRNMHQELPSDLFLTLLAAGATINISTNAGENVSYYDLESMLDIDLMATKSTLLQINFTALPPNSVYRSFKIMPRSANSRAYVAGAFNLQFDIDNGHTVIGRPVLAFTGISSEFYRATETEAYLLGKDLEDVSVLQGALTSLAYEIPSIDIPEDPSPAYKIACAQNIFYKYVLGILGDQISAEFSSGATEIIRPISSGIQTFEDNVDTYPLGQPIPKLEAKIQCSGEAEYVRTMKPFEDELVGMFVQSKISNAKITSIDATEALAIDGVVAFISAEDIPGVNNIIVYADQEHGEELFPSDRVSYYGQPIGLIVTTSRGVAYRAVNAVQVTYEDEQPPILTIQEAIDQDSLQTTPGMDFTIGDVDAGMASSDTVIDTANTMTRGGQFHFSMETQTCVTVPIEDGYDVYSSTQWLTETQASIAQILGLPANDINITVRRLGGAYGSKIDRCNIIASASALAAHVTHKPVRIDLDLSVNMNMIGWRDPYLCEYKIGVTAEGLLNAIDVTLTCDSGYIPLDASVYNALDCMPSCYQCPNWRVRPQVAITNTASNTWCRAPSTVEGITFIENIMEHAAFQLGMDPLEFRRLNLSPDAITRKVKVSNPKTRTIIKAMGPSHAHLLRPKEMRIETYVIGDMIDQIIASSDYDSRKAEIGTFNENNRWRKRGIAIMPMLWPYYCPEVYGFGVLVSIYGKDGTVAIAHGGTEIGQGMSTKVAQVAAYTLGCDLDKVKIKPTNTLSGANSNCTGGSIGSDVNMYCIRQAAQKLRDRLDLIDQPTWEEKVREAFNQGVDLTERYWNGAGEVKSYPVFGVACTEVEVDILTGNFIVSRTDILEDAGSSPSPLVDIGQVEGAFVMGQGLLTSELPVLDPTTGRKISDTTWIYKPPLALDIPADFRVSFLENSPNPDGVMSSKVTGEPPLCLSFSIVMALRQAIASARKDAGNTDWFIMNAPLTIDNIQQLCLIDQEMLTFGTGSKKKRVLGKKTKQ